MDFNHSFAWWVFKLPGDIQFTFTTWTQRFCPVYFANRHVIIQYRALGYSLAFVPLYKPHDSIRCSNVLSTHFLIIILLNVIIINNLLCFLMNIHKNIQNKFLLSFIKRKNFLFVFPGCRLGSNQSLVITNLLTQ